MGDDIKQVGQVIPRELVIPVLKAFMNEAPDPVFEFEIAMGLQQCKVLEADSPILDYYIRSLHSYASLLVERGYSTKLVGERVGPMFSYLHKSKESGSDVRFCDGNGNTEKIITVDHAKPSKDETTALFDKFGISSVPEMAEYSGRLYAGKVDPDSDVLVILWPDIHPSKQVNTEFLKVFSGLYFNADPSYELYLGVERPPSSCKIPPPRPRNSENDSENDAARKDRLAELKKKANEIVSDVMGKGEISTSAEVVARFLGLLANSDLKNIAIEGACLEFGICSPAMVMQIGFVGSIIDRIFKTTFNQDQVWDLEDCDLYLEQLMDVKKTNGLDLQVARSRSAASVENLLEFVDKAREGGDEKKPMVVFVEQGAVHIDHFIEDLKDKRVSFVALVPSGFVRILGADDFPKVDK